MKKIILLLILPFMVNAQTAADIKTNETKQTIEGYRQRVIKGESMADLAKKYSEDPGSNYNGGRYDGIVKGVMVPEFEKAAFSLKPGEISEVFETEYGFHFIQLISRKGDTLDLRHILVRRK